MRGLERGKLCSESGSLALSPRIHFFLTTESPAPRATLGCEIPLRFSDHGPSAISTSSSRLADEAVKVSCSWLVCVGSDTFYVSACASSSSVLMEDAGTGVAGFLPAGRNLQMNEGG